MQYASATTSGSAGERSQSDTTRSYGDRKTIEPQVMSARYRTGAWGTAVEECYSPLLDCSFCTLSPDRIIMETAHTIAFTDGFPVAPGHTLMIPRRHVASIFDLAPEERTAVWDLVAHIRGALAQALHPDGFNIGINDGTAAGQTVMNAHVHVIQRWTGGCSRSSWRRAMSHPGYGGTGGSCRAANAISAHRGRRRRRKACLRPAQKRASQPNPCPRFNSRALSGADAALPWPVPSCQVPRPLVYPVLPQNSRSRSPALRQRPASAGRFASGALERRPSVSADRDMEASVPGFVLA